VARRRRRHTTRGGNPLLELPPATFEAVDPTFVTLPVARRLIRVHSPQPYGAEPLTFRGHGPHARFDHHRCDADGKARTDAERGAVYAGESLVCCLGEFFADSCEIAVRGTKVATVRVVEPLTLLDLRGTAATGVGTTQAIAAISQRKTTQAWARYWYDHPMLTGVHGLLYTASNSGSDAIAFWERADGKLEVLVDLDLADPALSAEVDLAADQLHWPIGR
jgi:hypothetical protein